MVLVYVFIAVAGPAIAPHPYDKFAVGPALDSPSLDHPFGTDEFGRDVFSRVLYGGRISLRVGALVVIVAGSIGVTVGLISGFYGGWIDEVSMRITDIFLAFPDLVMALVVATALGTSIESAIIGIAIVRWTSYARLMRSSVLAQKGKDYMLAGRALGVHPTRLIWRHILPNSYSPVLVQATLDFGLAILLAAGRRFLNGERSYPAAASTYRRHGGFPSSRASPYSGRFSRSTCSATHCETPWTRVCVTCSRTPAGRSEPATPPLQLPGRLRWRVTSS